MTVMQQFESSILLIRLQNNGKQDAQLGIESVGQIGRTATIGQIGRTGIVKTMTSLIQM